MPPLNQAPYPPAQVFVHLVPKIQKDGTILMQYAMNISELVGSQNGFETFSSNGSTSRTAKTVAKGVGMSHGALR